MTLRIGNYDVSVQYKEIPILVEDKYGEPMRVKLKQVLFGLQHSCGELIIFKRHKHCGIWKWSDSRLTGTQTTDYILKEVARLLFNNDISRAKALLIAGLNDKAPIE